MPTATIAKTFSFEAAHQLPNHAGKCAQLHGHSYRVEVRCYGDVNGETGDSDEGMVLDFATLKEAWQELHVQVDHRCLNDVLPFPTTAENLAGWVLTEMHRRVPQVVSVRLWETAGCWAEVSSV
jgi:6-pyruvoyltetrahydropterin/6-carboxytetrahydropterin synthase